MSRDIRRLNNSTEQSQSFSTGAPATTLQEGGTFVSIENGNLAVYRKHKGIEFKNYMTRGGNQLIDKKLTASELEYTRKFIDYRHFVHNFTDDIGTSEHYIPWAGTGEQASMNVSTTGFLAPFNMSMQKIIIRPETITDVDALYTIKLYKQENGSTSVVNVASASTTSRQASNTSFELSLADFDNLPSIVSGTKCGISITANVDPTGAEDWYITSVWRVEVTT
tara:strand:+ start:6251 stop:6919 length:669 start_codon:yes stop_codon:yes gene_type:complete